MKRNAKRAVRMAAVMLLTVALHAGGQTPAGQSPVPTQPATGSPAPAATQTTAPAATQTTARAPTPTSTLKPETEQLLKEGEQALAAKHYDDAAKDFKKASKAENDKCVRCYLNLANAQSSQNDLKGALSSCDKAVAVATDDTARAEGHGFKGDVLIGTGDAKRLKEAEAEYQTALQLAPNVAQFHLRLAIAMMKESRDAEGKEELATYLKLAPKGKYASYAKQLQDNPRRVREEYLPDFQLTTIKGQAISSSDFLGKVVVMDFWATWCPPCRASVPEIKDLTKKYPSDKVVVLSVSADKDDAKWREFIEKKNMDWLQYRDADEHVLKMMGIHAFPTYIVVDTEGIIRERIVGENPQQSIVGRLKDKLQKMMPQG